MPHHGRPSSICTFAFHVLTWRSISRPDIGHQQYGVWHHVVSRPLFASPRMSSRKTLTKKPDRHMLPKTIASAHHRTSCNQVGYTVENPQARLLQEHVDHSWPCSIPPLLGQFGFILKIKDVHVKVQKQHLTTHSASQKRVSLRRRPNKMTSYALLPCLMWACWQNGLKSWF